MKKFIVFLGLSLILLSLVGCDGSDTALLKKKNVINMIETSIPNAKFVSMQHKDGNDKYGENLYTFDNGEFTFELKNEMYIPYMYIPFIGGRIHNKIHTDYLYRLIEANSEEVRKMASDNGIILFINELDGTDYYTLELLNMVDSYPHNVLMTLDIQNINSYDANINLTIVLNDYTHIDAIYNFLNSFYSYFQPYFAIKEIEDLDLNLTYRIHMNTVNVAGSRSTTLHGGYFKMLSNSSSIDSYEQYWVKYVFADLVRNGMITNKSLDYATALKFKPISISKLNIDGVEYTCPNTFSFVYNIKQDSYYGTIYAGVSLSTNPDKNIVNTTDEGSQKHLLETLYGDVSYIINKDSVSKGYSSYKINGSTYKIVRTDLNEFEFYKDGKELLISDLNMLPFVSSGTNFQYICLEDFATLMGLHVNRIDTVNGIIYFNKQ